MTSRHLLFLLASTRLPGVLGNTEALARHAAAALPADVTQTWLHLRGLQLPAFEDHRHGRGDYPMPEGDGRQLLDATLAATELVFVAPIYWYSLPSPLKLYLDHWSAWLRVPGLDFKARMAGKPLALITTSGDRPKAQPAIDSVRLCAEFMGMRWAGALWGKGGAPGAVAQDMQALDAAARFLVGGGA
ncbi:flavodoxin family protein [Ideonella sp. BN130291]|uniref:flavodoxin family protein n=1 Tax=Ideonella sp. BN130291 TaxID=3112940 RepID=UPI002E263013|nr:NAD(P)H-dependent oxidoreductase [Ideonella sp. BN130291]